MIIDRQCLRRKFVSFMVEDCRCLRGERQRGVVLICRGVSIVTRFGGVMMVGDDSRT